MTASATTSVLSTSHEFCLFLSGFFVNYFLIGWANAILCRLSLASFLGRRLADLQLIVEVIAQHAGLDEIEELALRKELARKR